MNHHLAAVLILLWIAPVALTIYACIDWEDPE